MKYYSWNFTISAFLLVMQSCDSPLSDVPITDPTVLKPVMEVEKSISTNGGISNIISCIIYDKNNNLVEIHDGGVKLNGIYMDSAPYGLGGTYYIPSESQPENIELDKTFTFGVMLSDGEVYLSSITTAAFDLTTFTVPSTYQLYSDLHIQWYEDQYSNEMSVKLNCSTGAVTEEFSIPTSDIQIGEYNIQPGAFPFDQCEEGFYVHLSSFREGDVDNRFRDGSKITSANSVTKYVSIEGSAL